MRKARACHCFDNHFLAVFVVAKHKRIVRESVDTVWRAQASPALLKDGFENG
jgi:hypothetical protein